MNNIFKLKHKKLQDTDIIDNYLGTRDKKRYSLSVKIIIIVLSILFCSSFLYLVLSVIPIERAM